MSSSERYTTAFSRPLIRIFVISQLVPSAEVQQKCFSIHQIHCVYFIKVQTKCERCQNYFLKSISLSYNFFETILGTFLLTSSVLHCFMVFCNSNFTKQKYVSKRCRSYDVIYHCCIMEEPKNVSEKNAKKYQHTFIYLCLLQPEYNLSSINCQTCKFFV